ncbi:ABC transporter substrate-binding protein [Glycomyces artemisiae]|uniref:Carbohydrate ABC transporter substrate-binding protein (CUT1 family) n=1 Tax=Glycomyces artemisiae TaxID=1076443 RepID=A0A2T0UHH2_9ACTN|nr:sugar ABC transporter substrate-binding protein [Glycomyces artemisiae]PRY57390.1 carbohydrate ABC transporter substrate-binding protein (CUT1 family) [Glycomyces artemisiae]
MRFPARVKGAAALAAATALLASACSGGGGGSDDEVVLEGVDDGTTLTMWTRAATEAQSQALVDAYNASHENQIELTVIPTDDYQTRVGTAAGNQELPDLFALDVVFAPNFTTAGAYLDITDRIDALDFADSLAPSHIDVGTVDGAKYLVPHTLDLSVLFWNKDLYAQAGLDPETPPATLAEFAEQARAVDALGGDVSGTFFGGNCGGCYVFTWWPSIWASGAEVMNEDGTESLLDGPEAQEVYATYRGLVEDDAVAPGHAEETGATWTGFFPEGNIGVMPMPSTMLGLMPEDMNIGVAPIPGVDGGESTFVGGDSIGIAANSEHPNQAWDFLRWSLEEEQQVEILAANGDVMARTDLADNEYYAANPNAVVMNDLVQVGRTPYSLNFGQTFNDPQGPWLPLVREAVYGDPGADLGDLNGDVTASLAS